MTTKEMQEMMNKLSPEDIAELSKAVALKAKEEKADARRKLAEENNCHVEYSEKTGKLVITIDTNRQIGLTTSGKAKSLSTTKGWYVIPGTEKSFSLNMVERFTKEEKAKIKAMTGTKEN